MMMGMGIGFIFMFFFWILIIILAVWGVGVVAKGGYLNPKNANHQTPLEIASERYARGEINRQEYELLKKELKEKELKAG